MHFMKIRRIYNDTPCCFTLFVPQDREKLLRKKRHKRSSRPIKVGTVVQYSTVVPAEKNKIQE